jgi:hypothetical protein
MAKYLIICFVLFFPPFSMGQTGNVIIDGLIIDSSIKNEVEKNIRDSEFSKQSEILIYNNQMFIDIFEDDKQIISSDKNGASQIFKSFYYQRGDTLGIDGAFGLFTGIGFSIKIAKGKAKLYHLVSSDEIPGYSYTSNGKLIFRLEVPCTETKIILSEVPNKDKQQVIYGYVEFKSGEYYSSKGSLPRSKYRVNMKIYFKSSLIHL